MGAHQTKLGGSIQCPLGGCQLGGANLPPEAIGRIGEFADPQTRTRMRRTGHDAFMTPVDHGPAIENYYLHNPDELINVCLRSEDERTRWLLVQVMKRLKEQPKMLKEHGYPYLGSTYLNSMVHSAAYYFLLQFIDEDQDAQLPDTMLRLNEEEVLDLELYEEHFFSIQWLFLTMDELCGMQSYLEGLVRTSRSKKLAEKILRDVFIVDVGPN